MASDELVERLTKMARRMRLNALKMAVGAGSGGSHLGGGMSAMEVFAVLYGEVMRFDVKRPDWPERDRMVASKAHCVLAHYAALAEVGFLSERDLWTFEKDGTALAGHPAMDVMHGLEYSGGSLGMALSFGIGMALDARRKLRRNNVYILLGDGECNEGSNWEAFMAAAHYGLDNLTAVIDRNQLQYDGATEDVMALGDLGAKLRAFGWHVSETNGHDCGGLLGAFSDFCGGKPHGIIAHTIKGKGVSFMEGAREWHHSRLSQEQYDAAVAEVIGSKTC